VADDDDEDDDDELPEELDEDAAGAKA